MSAHPGDARDELLAELDALGSARREAELREALQGPAPEFEARALARFEASLEAPHRRPRRGWALALLAAGLAAALLWWRGVVLSSTPPEPPPRTWLGDGITDLVPTGPAASYEQFTWRGPEVPGVSYELRLFRPGESEPFLTLETEEPRWRPPPTTRDSLPDVLVWEVRARDGTGTRLGAARSEASRSER